MPCEFGLKEADAVIIVSILVSQYLSYALHKLTIRYLLVHVSKNISKYPSQKLSSCPVMVSHLASFGGR